MLGQNEFGGHHRPWLLQLAPRLQALMTPHSMAGFMLGKIELHGHHMRLLLQAPTRTKGLTPNAKAGPMLGKEDFHGCHMPAL